MEARTPTTWCRDCHWLGTHCRCRASKPPMKVDPDAPACNCYRKRIFISNIPPKEDNNENIPNRG